MSGNGHTPKCIPLCYPNNFEWDKEKGILEEKRKSRGKLVLCEDALEIIRSIDGPICPVAVTGPARCGKSYIASQLIEPRPQDCVFKTSHKQKPETMGIWMGTKVFKKTLVNGTDVTVIIMDTEGLDAYNAHEDDDMLMFALMSLMSSVLIYNSKGTMKGEDLQKLSWVSKLNDVFQGDDECGRSTKIQEKDIIKFFPNFMWLLRDVTMSCSLEGEDGDEQAEVDIRDYLLEEVLKLEKETAFSDKRVRELNATRRALLKSFPVFDASQLSIPSIDTSVLKDMGQGDMRERLSQTFLEDVDKFLARCGSLMKPKKAWPYVGNINGRQFADMLQQYVTGFSATNSINMRYVATKVIEALLGEIEELAFEDYVKAMDGYAESALPCENYEIINKHNTCLFKAMRTFNQNSKYINDAERLHQGREKLKERTAKYSEDGRQCVGGYLQTILKQNETESASFCTKLVDELLEENLKMSNISHINKLYKELARGPQIWHVYKTVLAEKIEKISREGSEGNQSETECNVTTQLDKHLPEDPVKEEKMEKLKTEEQLIAMKEKEDETMREIVNEDLTKQEEQSDTDFNESSASIKMKVETLLRTHGDLAKELLLINAKLEEENKRLKDELNRKREKMLR
ncbi:guanylate-binding protein 2-like [Ptychodera flava]|uniref:guanylate-binding protein 2-like n=1 Tax=Ptychodera flava TaxID=63121 RepID=UPI003969D45A